MPEVAGVRALVLVREDDQRRLADVVHLADRNRSTLGLMPRGAFPELAAKGGLLTAIDDTGTVVGYALFSVSLRRVRLIHLCVADTHRHRGIARSLVRRISDLYPDTTGIVLRCRRDYTQAMATWPTLGFVPTGESPGRGRDRAPLTHWRLSHHLPDLFSLSQGEDDTIVAIDHNIFLDLLDPTRSGADESRWLSDQWLPEGVVLKVTAVSSQEAVKNSSESERRRQLHTLSVFPSLEYAARDGDDARDKWRSAVPDAPDEDRAACDHLISTAAGGAGIFVTRDDRLIERYAGPANEVFGIRVIRPSDLTVHLDELTNGSRYQPVALRGTNFQVSEWTAGSEHDLDDFLANRAGERKNTYHRILREVAGDVTAQGWWVHDPTGRLVAAWAWRPSPADRTLHVPLLRTADTPIGATLGRLIPFKLRRDARREGLRSILVTDPTLPAGLHRDLLADGFLTVPDGLEAAVLDVRDTASAAQALPPTHALHDLVRDALTEASSHDRIAALERSLWPAKLLDTDLPCYLVPIQPRWARTLFALNETLWVDSELLGLSREHVYYRSPRATPQVPARIAWYASSNPGRDGKISSVVAVSLLVEVDIATPSVLFQRYRRLGVYRREDLKGHGGAGLAAALRFVDTERLPSQVPLEQLRGLPGFDQIPTLRGPSRMPRELFAAIYNQGNRPAP